MECKLQILLRISGGSHSSPSVDNLCFVLQDLQEGGRESTTTLSHGQAHPGTTAASDAVRETRLEVKMAKTVGFVFLFLVIVWIPVLILEIFYAIGSQSCIIEKLGVVSLWLTCSNGVINPVVYSLRNKDFHRAILQLIHCKRPLPSPLVSTKNSADLQMAIC